MAPTGQAVRQAGFAQWLQAITRLKTAVSGKTPLSVTRSLRQRAGPGSTWFQSLQDTVQVLHPMQRLWSK